MSRELWKSYVITELGVNLNHTCCFPQDGEIFSELSQKFLDEELLQGIYLTATQV